MGLFDSLTEAAEEWELEALLTMPLDSPTDSQPTTASVFQVQPSKPRAPKQNSKAVKWTDEDDELLKQLVPKLKPDWKKIAQHFPGRPKSAVRRRWENRFDPDIKKTAWTEAEDLMISTLLERIGPIWKDISQHLPGRPPDMIKNRYYGHIRRQPPKPVPVSAPCEEDWENLLSLQPEEPQPGSSAKEQLREEIAKLEMEWKLAKTKLQELEGNTPSTED
jgi:hypothetical protein